MSPFLPFIAPLFPVVVVLAVLWGIHRIRYTIDDRYVRVVLGRITLRKVALSDIEAVDTKIAFWNEHWCNLLFAWGRIVWLRRKTGIARNFIITPANRNEFIRQLNERLGVNCGR